ncbi:UNKNOWN [Stylonychia lemnae]|uniref:Uncharacterized protein n=1 Tax=Stylonychia lemnae TaxID=5949 RepID=A0A078A6D2_STYLE|nr:UNKNOWN [Stylonychia lemnae]|eukprot:CDW77135.1 UNKNOWN [Stylonychia lemnae]
MISSHYSQLIASQKFEKGKLKHLTGQQRSNHPIRVSNGSFSTTANIIKNIKEEENLRQCEQLIHELQEELPGGQNHANTSRSGIGSLTQRSMSRSIDNTASMITTARNFNNLTNLNPNHTNSTNLSSQVTQIRDLKNKYKKQQPQVQIQNLKELNSHQHSHSSHIQHHHSNNRSNNQNAKDYYVNNTSSQQQQNGGSQSKRQSFDNSVSKINSSNNPKKGGHQRNPSTSTSKKGVISTSINLCTQQQNQTNIQHQTNPLSKQSYFSHYSSFNQSNINDKTDSLQMSINPSDISNSKNINNINSIQIIKNNLHVRQQSSSKEGLFEEQSTIRPDDYSSIENYQTARVTKRKVDNYDECANEPEVQDVDQTPNSQQRTHSVSRARKSVIGQTSSTILMLDKQLTQLQKENQELKDKLEISYQNQHNLENEMEEFQVEFKRKEEEMKHIKKKFQDFQKQHFSCEKERRDLNEKYQKAEKEKVKINEKYIKLSQRLKDNNVSSEGVRIKEYQQIYQKQLEEINSLRVKLQQFEEKENNSNNNTQNNTLDMNSLDHGQKIFQRFSSELVCACLHELMLELSQKMPITGDETFDIAKFQQFLREQNCKECGHSELIDLELGSIIVLGCKRIKDLTYLTDEQAEKLNIMTQQYQTTALLLNEKTLQFEQLQSNLLNMLQINTQQTPLQQQTAILVPQQNHNYQSFFNGQTTMSSSQIYKHLNFQTQQTLGTQNTIEESPQVNFSRKFSNRNAMLLQQSQNSNLGSLTGGIVQQSMQNPSFLFGNSGSISGKENWNHENYSVNNSLNAKNSIFRNQKCQNRQLMAVGRSQSPIDFGGQSAIRNESSPDQTGILSGDTSMLNFNNQQPIMLKQMSRQPSHQTLLSNKTLTSQRKIV